MKLLGQARDETKRVNKKTDNSSRLRRIRHAVFPKIEAHPKRVIDKLSEYGLTTTD
ncbi:hypothetical protein CANARDRAFT_176164 [[Candida] arabinofermentans NRRL YB-2248]|uniref:Uncharacterized protein n=1 Tax=[Candida] arabinofermentans NRRL YB-2248 TaxID=983967 RepID=A0A1E4T0D4_9ASCO|nr:hypothetical protein CANARDRAFT_176164 [[Candida] arabinofermentans NRRL YB-2248]